MTLVHAPLRRSKESRQVVNRGGRARGDIIAGLLCFLCSLLCRLAFPPHRHSLRCFSPLVSLFIGFDQHQEGCGRSLTYGKLQDVLLWVVTRQTSTTTSANLVCIKAPVLIARRRRGEDIKSGRRQWEQTKTNRCEMNFK